MGREVYLNKIAFGRSAFIPTQSATESAVYTQLESSQSEIPQRYLEATANNYLQLYDERGNPTNPRAREYGKKLRSAQSDVLASVGVVQRRAAPEDGLPGSYQERMELLEDEDGIGHFLSLTSRFTEKMCTWWIRSIRARVMTFRYPVVVPFSQIIASEVTTCGASLFYAGFPSQLCAIIIERVISHGIVLYQPLTRLLLVTRAGTRTRQFFRRSQVALRLGLRWALEILSYPFSYHARLQRLGLVPASLLLPTLASLNPWSASSPLSPISIHYDASASLVNCILAFLTSPFVLSSAERFANRVVGGCIHEAIDTSVLRPRIAELPLELAEDKELAVNLFGRRQSPPMIRNLINRVMACMGWGRPLKTVDVKSQQGIRRRNGHSIRVGGTEVDHVHPLEMAAVRDPALFTAEAVGADVETTSNGARNEPHRPATPPSPGRLAVDAADDDPRIRITSREGMVEMEVRLPSRVISSHTEVAEGSASEPGNRTTAFHEDLPVSDSDDWPHYHFTLLSTELARMISAMLEAQLIGLALLPLQVLSYRAVGRHYLGSGKAQGMVAHDARALLEPTTLSWRGLGSYVSRMALCAAVEFAMGLGLWGVQYVGVTFVGQECYGWGTL